MNFIKKRKGAIQLHINYIREILNHKRTKIKKITKAIKMKAIQGNHPLLNDLTLNKPLLEGA
jgi:5-bromo-4-chloroindolyl phosphate hydrolysis protein